MARASKLKHYDNHFSDLYTTNGNSTKDWDGRQVISFFARGSDGVLIKKKLHLVNIFKIGYDYIEEPDTNGNFKKLKFNGYIIDVFGRVYDGIRHNSFEKINTFCSKNGSFKVTKFDIVYKKHDTKDVIVFATAKEYFYKFIQTGHFKPLHDNIMKNMLKTTGKPRVIPSDTYEEDDETIEIDTDNEEDYENS